MPKFCRNCGTPLKDGIAFCGNCGEPVVPAAPTAPAASTPEQPAYQQTVRQTVQQFTQPIQQAIGGIQNLAPSTAGEFAIDLGGQALAAPVTQTIGKITNPIAALFGGFGAWFTGIFKSFTSLRALLFTAGTSALWIWLNSVNSSSDGSGLTEILSVLTFAEGGTRGSTSEIIGGIVGKGIVGAGYCTFLFGGIPKMFRGIKAIFTEKGFNFGSFLLGLAFSAAVYMFCAGSASESGFMVGVLGAVMSLEALSQKNGFLYSLAASFSAKKLPDKSKILRSGQYKGILTGAAVGALIAPVIAPFVDETGDFYLFLLIVGVVGLIITLATKGKAVQE